MTRTKVALWLFASVSVINLAAALIPVLKGESPNVAFLGVGVVFFVITLAVAKRASGESAAPPAA